MKKKQHKPITEFNFLPESLQEQIEQIFEKYLSLGLLTRLKVEGNLPAFPKEISILDSSELSNIHATYTGWYAYSKDKLKYYAVACNVLRDALKQTEGQILLSIYEKHGRKEKADFYKAHLQTNIEFTAMLRYSTAVNSLKEMLEHEAETLEKQMMSLAREMRKQENIRYE